MPHNSNKLAWFLTLFLALGCSTRRLVCQMTRFHSRGVAPRRALYIKGQSSASYAVIGVQTRLPARDIEFAGRKSGGLRSCRKNRPGDAGWDPARRELPASVLLSRNTGGQPGAGFTQRHQPSCSLLRCRRIYLPTIIPVFVRVLLHDLGLFRYTVTRRGIALPLWLAVRLNRESICRCNEAETHSVCRTPCADSTVPASTAPRIYILADNGSDIQEGK